MTEVEIPLRGDCFVCYPPWLGIEMHQLSGPSRLCNGAMRDCGNGCGAVPHKLIFLFGMPIAKPSPRPARSQPGTVHVRPKGPNRGGRLVATIVNTFKLEQQQNVLVTMEPNVARLVQS